MRPRQAFIAFGLIGVCLAGSAQAQQPVGETVFARGAATAQVGDNVRLIGKGTPIFEGDVLSTGGRSFAIVNFNDGTRMTLRPDTVFEVQQFRNQGERPSALMRLFKGGFRAVTGVITKLNPFNGFRVQTTLATIGIRGTDFSARLCGDDCASEQQELADDEVVQDDSAAEDVASRVVARVAFMRGNLNGQTTSGESRTLRTGAAIYEGDTLETGRGSFAVLAFRDETRVTMQVGTVFRVAAHRYQPERPTSSFSLMSLLKGGLRIATGLIGKVNRRQFRIGTPVATIGIRGTSFDLVCQGSCAGDATASAPNEDNVLGGLLDFLITPAFAVPPQGDGMYILSREGGLFAEQDGREINLPEGQNMFLRNIALPPEIGVEVPLAVQEGLGPLPESVEVPDNFFAADPLPTEPGLIVAVYDEGHATVEQPDGTLFHLGRDEALHTNGSQMLNILGGPPPVVRNDPYNFKPSEFTGASLLNSAGLPNVTQTDDALECRI